MKIANDEQSEAEHQSNDSLEPGASAKLGA